MTTQPDSALFRQQALDAHGTHSIGAIVLAQPVPLRVAVWIAAAIALATALLLTFAEYTRKVRVTGTLAPTAGSVRVVAPQFARVVRLFVRDDQRVDAGQPLLELSAERDGSAGSLDGEIGGLLATRLREREQTGQLQVDELQQREAMLAQQQSSLEAEVASRRRALVQQGQLVQNARDKERRYRGLAKQGFVSAESMSDVSAELSAQLARREEFASNLLMIERQLVAATDESRSINVKLKQIASLARQDVAGLRQEAAEHAGRTRIRVTAPIAGTVTALAPDTGQTVNAGSALVTILPTGSVLEARLMIPARAIAFVEQGQQVRMRLEGLPYQKFGPVFGVVEHIDRSPTASSDAGVLYRVTVRLSRQSATLYGKEKPFTDGMPLEADILQDRRRLIEWLIDPLIAAVKGRAH